MEKRYYYTDPLAAAWMAKHHGVRFVLLDGSAVSEGMMGNQIRGDWDYGAFYIHPDSLHLLEPQAGDLLSWASGLHIGSPHYFGSDCVEEGLENHTIIQRNGIAFMWPESEEV